MKLSGLKAQNFSVKNVAIFFPKKTRSEKMSYIFSKESCSYISGNGAPHLLVPDLKIFLKNCSEKISYISKHRA